MKSSFNLLTKGVTRVKRSKNDQDIVIALAGNPNTGKSTIFNALTGLRQHTGNWTGKTVTNAQGYYDYKGKSFLLVDLPGTYSLLANSQDELIARDFICFGRPDATIVVLDATNLERNLNLALQIMEATTNVIIAVNLLDEAQRKGIIVDIDGLSEELGVPVIGTVARTEKGLDRLKETVDQIVNKKITLLPYKITYSDEIEQKIADLLPKLEPILKDQLNPRWTALRLIEGDDSILQSIENYLIEKESGNRGEIALCLE